MREYLSIGPRADDVATPATDTLDATTERHHLMRGVDSATATADPLDPINRCNGVAGVVIGLTNGIPDRARLGVADVALKRYLRVWLLWPNGQAVECVDDERSESPQRRRRAASLTLRRGASRPSATATTRVRRGCRA